MLEVIRRCLVCDAETTTWEQEHAEPIGSPCAACHAPTERIQVLAQRVRATAPNPHAAALGRLGGLKGGPARATVLSPERRREIARRAALKRWSRGR
jgi:hypothetical protein